MIPAASNASLPPQQPTRVRYWVIGTTALMSFLLYLDRFCFSFVEYYVKEEQRISEAQTGILMSAFFLTYALAQVPAGWLGDRYGVRWVLAGYLAVWSLFTGLMGLAQSFGMFLMLRLACGIAQAGAYPTAAALVRRWMPLLSRGCASGCVTLGGRLGGSAATLMTAYLMVAFVPISAPARLTEADLLDPPKETERTTPSATEAPEVDRLREIIAGKLPASLSFPPRSEAFASGKIPVETRAALAAVLNDVLDQRDLGVAVAVTKFYLPGEAKRLFRVPADRVTPEQVVRRNRLLLEVAFPQDVRKLQGLGWRPTLLLYGFVGIALAVVYALVVRSAPRDHPGCNAAEISLVDGPATSAPAVPTRMPPLPWAAILTNRSLWMSCVLQFATNFGWLFLLTWLPRYLAEVHKVPPVERGWMASVTIFSGVLGMWGGGWLTDRLTSRFGLRWGRRWPVMVTRFTAMGAYLACIALGPLGSPWLIVAALCVVAISTDLGTPAVWAFKQDIGGRHVGAILGWGNMWGNFGATLAPVALKALVSGGNWNGVFWACAAAFFVAGVAALGLDATKPIVAKERDLSVDS